MPRGRWLVRDKHLGLRVLERDRQRVVWMLRGMLSYCIVEFRGVRDGVDEGLQKYNLYLLLEMGLGLSRRSSPDKRRAIVLSSVCQEVQGGSGCSIEAVECK